MWQCPDNVVTLVKAISVGNRDAAAQDAQVIMQSASPGATIYILNQSITSGAVVNLQTWQVLNPGDTIYIGTSGNGLDVWLAGAILLGPPPFPPNTKLTPVFQP
jgi:hypothetical protein